LTYIQTLDHYFVTLDRDGRFQVSGVPAGDYDLAIRLYEPPAGGCLVSPVGSRIVPFQVTEEAARGPSLDLGNIEVKAALGPRPGGSWGATNCPGHKALWAASPVSQSSRAMPSAPCRVIS